MSVIEYPISPSSSVSNSLKPSQLSTLLVDHHLCMKSIQPSNELAKVYRLQDNWHYLYSLIGQKIWRGPAISFMKGMEHIWYSKKKSLFRNIFVNCPCTTASIQFWLPLLLYRCFFQSFYCSSVACKAMCCAQNSKMLNAKHALTITVQSFHISQLEDQMMQPSIASFQRLQYKQNS